MPKKYGGLRRFSLKWWLALPFSLGDIFLRFTPKDPMVHAQCYWWYGDLPRKHPQEVFPDAAFADIRMLNVGRRDPTTSTTLYELGCLLMGRAQADAEKIVEVGTFDGNTTLNLAANVGEEGLVVTLDLPLEEQEPELGLEIDSALRNVTDRQVVGEQFQNRPEKERIRQVFGDSARLDWKELPGPFDMAFIDGCHAYEYVKSDTANALKVLRPGGLVIWHDYAEMEDVSRAVDEFQDRFDDMCALQGTRLAVGWKKKG
jgi:predicted O-methyltransferase YrrM